jgi:hypothetical protein
MGFLWRKVRDEKLYKSELTPDFRKFIEKDTPYSKSMVYAFISLADWYGDYEDTKAVEYSRLIHALPYIKSKEDAEEWYHKAVELPGSAYKDEIAEVKGKVPTDDCNHANVAHIGLEVCKDCGKCLSRTESSN